MISKTCKVIKKLPKKIVAIIVTFALTLACFIPLSNVIANSFGNNSDNFITFNITNELGFTIDSVTINGNNWTNNSDEFHEATDEYHIEVNLSGNETTGEMEPYYQYGGNWNGLINPGFFVEESGFKILLDVNLSSIDAEHRGEYNFLDLTIVERQNQPGPGEPGEPGVEPGPEEGEGYFDGKAYVLWSCGTGVCYHYFDNIPNFDDGNSTFYKDTTITADNNSQITFDVDAEYKAWALAEKFEFWVDAYKAHNNLENINWSQVDPEDIISEYPPNMSEWEEQAVQAHQNDPTKGCARPAGNAPREEREEFEHCVDEYYVAAGNLPFIRLQPVGEPSYKNAYVSYGDRNFKVVIYNDEYKGIAMGSLDELHYYPAEWTNPFVKRDQFDISETTKAKPSPINSILLESTVIIKALNYNDFAISSIEALDVPDDAVTVSKVNNEFRLEFSSNFYDNVVFKVTDTKGGVSYVQVKRYTIDGWIRGDEGHPTLVADFYFDRTKSYTDFILTAKILFKDGTTKNVTLTAQNGIDDGLGNITQGYEVDEQITEFGQGGKGLKRSTFTYPLEPGDDRNIQDVYLNAEYTGSTASNYAGAYVGSGEGVLANIYHGEDD